MSVLHITEHCDSTRTGSQGGRGAAALRCALMSGPSLRKALVVSVVLAACAAIVRAVRGRPAPAFELPGGPSAPWPTLRPEATPDWVGPAAAPADAEPLAAPPNGEAPPTPAWLEATNSPPPASHPVKAKLGSGIYHLPGMMNYERTRPDRWYRSAAEAEADGLRVAKR